MAAKVEGEDAMVAPSVSIQVNYEGKREFFDLSKSVLAALQEGAYKLPLAPYLLLDSREVEKEIMGWIGEHEWEARNGRRREMLVIDGKPRMPRHFRVRACYAETTPAKGADGQWYKCKKPTGEYYVEVWYRDGTFKVIPGRPTRTQRPSGRWMYSLTREAQGQAQ